jgi:hypothetical protein
MGLGLGELTLLMFLLGLSIYFAVKMRTKKAK